MPVLTLSTDIGHGDYITGAIKGQLITAVPSCIIADITHQLSPHNYQQAAYICKNAFKYFPQQTFHIVIINFFERAPRHILLTEYNQQYIICPDNGILTMITGAKPKNIFSILNTDDKTTLLECTKKMAETIEKIMHGESFENVMTSITTI